MPGGVDRRRESWRGRWMRCAEGRTKVPPMCTGPSASSVGVLGSRLACRAGFLLLTRACDRSGSQFPALGGPG